MYIETSGAWLRVQCPQELTCYLPIVDPAEIAEGYLAHMRPRNSSDNDLSTDTVVASDSRSVPERRDINASPIFPPKERIMVTVDQLMAKSLINIDAGRSVIEAAKLMKTHKVGSVLVKKENRIIGIVTEPDIIRRVVGAERVPYYVPVEEIMSSPVIGIDWRSPIAEAANMMKQHGTRHLAVLNGGSIVGVLSVRDILQPVSSLLCVAGCF